MAAPRILVLESRGSASAAVRAAGGKAVSVHPWDLEKVDDALLEGRFDGLLLTGGGDVDPRLYGVKRPHKRVYGVDEERDIAELVALDRAEEMGIPVLGICRGSQIMNVWANGTLVQHIGGHAGGKHPVHAFKGTALRQAFGGRVATVVSLHHQVVGVPGTGIRVVAKSHDGHPEAIESVDGRMMGVQFHPEMDSRAPYARGIFRWLVVEAAQRAGIEIDATPVRAAPKQPPLPLPELPPQTREPAPAKRGVVPHTGVVTRYYCPGCRSGTRNLVFDLREDLLGHMEMVHGTVPEAWR